MKYLLDTNVCVVYLRGKNPLVRTRFASRSPADLRVCSIVVAELCHGACGSSNPTAEQLKVDQFLQSYISLPFDDTAASVYGPLRSGLEASGLIIPDIDLMIAAIALDRGLTVVTHNLKHFSRVTGLSLEDWEQP